MLAGKVVAYVVTGSAAILSDAAESVVHVVAVTFAAYSLWYSNRPADETHPYGHDKISFFSAGFEGGMIVVAAIYIIYEAIYKWITGLELQNLGIGTVLVATAAALNGALGAYLIWQGKRFRSLILEANGRHVLTDCFTSVGVIVSLILVQLTGWLVFDPILAILVAINILISGGRLMRRSIAGLMDEVDPGLGDRLRRLLEELVAERGVAYHCLRYRSIGNRLWVEFHLLFPRGTEIEEAHRVATELEMELDRRLKTPVEVMTHLESIEGHAQAHLGVRHAPEIYPVQKNVAEASGDSD
jgi:cation diffusion facilitator family transporter